MTIDKRCNICNSDDFCIYLRIKDKSVDIVRCKACNAFRTVPYPKVDYTDKEMYCEHYLKNEPVFRMFADNVINIIARHKKQGRLLDIGCSVGFMLEAASKLGFDAEGLELNKKAVDIALSKKLNVRICGIEEAGYIKKSFDVVILNHILEHIFNPVEFIQKICDPEHPQKEDLSNVIDFMFLTNRGQIEEYKNAYNLKRVYYMPQGYDSYIQHRLSMKEIYDIGFSGAISNEPLHKTRRELIETMSRKYQVKISNNVRNNITEFYSQSKTVFGVSDFNYELYTSNRFFVALGCGACYVTKKFKGIELLAENKKHLLWFETKEELLNILDYYLSHDSEREKIRQSAEKLALEKHTYADRIKNVLDIIESKAEKFNGFL